MNMLKKRTGIPHVELPVLAGKYTYVGSLTYAVEYSMTIELDICN